MCVELCECTSRNTSYLICLSVQFGLVKLILSLLVEYAIDMYVWACVKYTWGKREWRVCVRVCLMFVCVLVCLCVCTHACARAYVNPQKHHVLCSPYHVVCFGWIIVKNSVKPVFPLLSMTDVLHFFLFCGLL